MQDVLVLLQHLAENEETTIKLMIECLYDVGAVNFINNKVDNTSINQFTKTIAKMSKPVAKRYGYHWFKNNCPELIVKWLQRKVTFAPPKKAVAVQKETSAPKDIVAESPSKIATDTQNAPVVDSSEPLVSDTVQAETVILGSETTAVDNTSASADLPAPEVVTTPLQTSDEVETIHSPEPTPSLEIPSAANTQPRAPEPVTLDRQNLNEVQSPPAASPSPTHHYQPKALPTTPSSLATDVLSTSSHVAALPTPLEKKVNQIRRLQTQNKVLIGSLVGTTLVSGLAIWQLHSTQQNALQLRQTTPSSIAPSIQSVE